MRRAAGVITGLAFAATAVWANAHSPDDYDHRYAPLATIGHVGEPVTTGGFTVKVERVTTAASVSSGDQGVIRPDGIFVIVTVSATSRRRPLQLSTALLRTADGREYRETVKSVTPPDADTLDAVVLSPELWRRGVFVFEIPPSRLAGSTLLVSDRSPNEKDPPDGFPPYGFELTAQADIDLGIDEARARRLVADAPEEVIIRGEGS